MPAPSSITDFLLRVSSQKSYLFRAQVQEAGVCGHLSVYQSVCKLGRLDQLMLFSILALWWLRESFHSNHFGLRKFSFICKENRKTRTGVKTGN